MSHLTEQQVKELITISADHQHPKIVLTRLQRLYQDEICLGEEDKQYLVPILKFISCCVNREAITFNISRGKTPTFDGGVTPYHDAYDDGYINASLDMANDELKTTLMELYEFIGNVCHNMIFKS
jgi:hypothetical protein